LIASSPVTKLTGPFEITSAPRAIGAAAAFAYVLGLLLGWIDSPTTHIGYWTLTILFPVYLFALYFGPTIVAVRRKHKNAMPIFVLDLLLGWTVLVWIGCLAWSCSDNVKA